MLRTLADSLFSKNIAIKWLKSKSPEEEIIFASAATLLESNNAAPIGWSLRRLFQHRGVVIITRKQIVFKDSLISVSAILELAILILSLIMLFRNHDWNYLPGVILFGVLTAQFLPYEKQIPLKNIRRLKLGKVRGIIFTGSLLTVYLKNSAFNIVPIQFLSEDVMQVISLHKREDVSPQRSA